MRRLLIGVLLGGQMFAASARWRVGPIATPEQYRAGFLVGDGNVTVQARHITPNGDGTATVRSSSPTYYNAPYGVGSTVTISQTQTCYDGTWTITIGCYGSHCSDYPIADADQYGDARITITTPCTETYRYESAKNEVMSIVGSTLYEFYRISPIYSSDIGDAGIISARKSTDGGATWGAEHTLFADATTGECAGNPAAVYGDVDYNPGNHCDLRLGGDAVGKAANGDLVLWYARYDWQAAGWLGNYYTICASGNDCSLAAGWSAPVRFTNTMLGVPGCVQVIPYGRPFLLNDGTTLVKPTWCGETTNEYLVLSCDNGVTWGVGSGCTNPVRLIGPIVTEENTFEQVVGSNAIIGFSRGCDSSCAPPDGILRFHYSSDNGVTWAAPVQMTFAPTHTGDSTNNQISPIVIRSGAGYMTLLFSEREDYTHAALRECTFVPADMIAAPTVFGTTTMWTSDFDDWGYPSAVMTGAATMAFTWSSKITAGMHNSVFNSTANLLELSLALKGLVVTGISIP